MSTAIVIAAGVFLGLLAWAVFCRWLGNGPRGDDALGGIAFHAARFYARTIHQLRVIGGNNIPTRRPIQPGNHQAGLIIVCNHTAGVDPILVQAALSFEPRWMMAADMQMPLFRPLWEWAGVISVQRGARDARAIREAIGHVQRGGVLGVFPEGGIERPPCRLRPFHPGVGLIVAKTGAPVLPILVSGTPQTKRAWGSLWVPSSSSLTIGPVMQLSGSPEAITAEIRAWFSRTSGWPDAA
jgi:1-acyl-sn-glycerol-3-phosphate acyltransferase